LWELILAMLFMAIQFFIGKSKPKQSSSCVSEIASNHPKSSWGHLLRLLLIGIIFSGATYLYIDGLTEAGAIVGSLALKISPVYAMLLGVLFLGEKVSWKQITLTMVMLFGLYYLGTAGTFVFGSFSLGFAKLLFVPLLWGIGHALTKPLLENHTISPIQIIVVRTSIISVVIGGTTIILYGFSSIGNALMHPEYLLFSLLMGGTYFFMHISWYNSITYIDLGYASALVTPSPAITTILAVSIGLETLHGYDIIGMAVVFISLFGLIWVNKTSSDRERNTYKKC
ncbi:MAG: DMT family transporter, partial [Candidatus Heimdallarchaeota archaeon]|nr:DMT family transporter [Candidatus Heimdallarchaeota archaeon]